MNTEKGKMSYVNNLKQIRNATLDTIYLGVIRAYLSCKTVGQALVEMYGTNPSKSQIRRILAEELENWACVQKSSNALQICDLRMKRRMRKMGAQPDMWIFPEGLKTYITNVRRENFDYFIKGPDGPKMFQSGVSNDGQQLDIAMDCVIFEAKQFDIPESPEPIDLLCRNQSIGEYVTLQNHLQGFNDWGKYSSRMRDIIVYNEERDSWSTLTLEQCLHYCMRFGEPPRVGYKRDRGDGDDNDDKRPPHHYGNEDDDMFLSGDRTPAVYMGDLTEFALNPRAVFDMSQCITERILREADGFNVISALSEGVKLCRTITQPSSTELTDYEDNLFFTPAVLDTSTTPPTVTTPEVPGLKIGSDGLPTVEGFSSAKAKTNKLLSLTGLGTYPGMKRIASIADAEYKEYKDIAENMVKAVDIIFNRLQSVGNSVFLDADYQQPWLKIPDGRNTLFANLIFEPIQQMFLKEKSTQVAVRLEQNSYKTAVPNQFAFNPDPANARDTRAGSVQSENGKFVMSLLNDINTKYLVFDTDKTFSTASEPYQFAESVKNAYFKIMKTSENISSEERALLEQESTLFVQCLARANVSSSDTNIVSNIIMVVYIARHHLVGEDTYRVDLIDLHRTMRYIFSSKDNDEFKTRMNNFISIVSMLYAILKDGKDFSGTGPAAKDALVKSRDSFLFSMIEKPAPYKAGDTMVFFTSGTTVNPGDAYVGNYLVSDATTIVQSSTDYKVATQLGLKYGDTTYDKYFPVGASTTLPRMFGTRLDAEFTTVNGFGMEVGSHEDDVMQARQVGAQDDFYFSGFQPAHKKRPGLEGRTFAGVTSFGGGDMGLEESQREMMMRAGQATAIKSKFSSTFLERYNYYSSQSASATDIHRIVSQAYLGLPLTLGNLKKLIYTDVPFPFGFICFRPYMTYRMGSGILAVKGNTTGETLIGHANFQLGDDPVQKMHIGNFTMYEKSVVYKPHQVGIAQNIYSMGYVGGNDCKFYSSREDVANNTPGNIRASIFSCLVPYEGNGAKDTMQSTSEFPNPMSITGHFENSVLKVLEENQGGGPHYPSASFYRSFWRWVEAADPDHSDKMYEVPATLNTVCYQGHQQAYNPSTYQYDIVTTNTGHWGEKIYPGCGKVRRGVEKMLQPVTYAGNATPYPSVTQLDY